MFELISVSKNYEEIAALKSVSVSVGAGKITAFLGPNGAGKTTAIKILAGLLKPDYGDAVICGHSILKEPVEAKRKFGYSPDVPMLFEYLTGIDYLNLIMDIFRIPAAERPGRVEKYIDAFDMKERIGKQIIDYSLGMKKKISIIAALCHEPEVFFLDEPTNGLDPKALKALKDIFSDLARCGKTVFFSTHILDIAEKMCDDAIIISKGWIIAQGAIDHIRSKASSDHATLEEVFLQITNVNEEHAAR
ncbi:MAG TPA: ABC transporter ATP-binding protein [Candidatus Wallbacteria bacterium]|nr:ABC transporter ATP-binding protein [Candidatus Wallbacteria bacterium]